MICVLVCMREINIDVERMSKNVRVCVYVCVSVKRTIALITKAYSWIPCSAGLEKRLKNIYLNKGNKRNIKKNKNKSVE